MSNHINSRPNPSQALVPYFLLLAAFVGGVVVDRAGWLPGRTSDAPPGVRKTFGIFWEAWHKVKEHYVDQEKADDRKMTEGAINGMLESLGDQGHTAYLTKEQRERHNQELSGKMEGIGARVGMRQQQPTIVQTMPGSPARSVGLRVGDVLVAVDGEKVAGKSLTQVTGKVRGKAGTQVQLAVRRDKKPEPLEFKVTRAQVNVPEVSWVVLPGTPRVAHLTLQRFSKTSAKEMEKALEEIQSLGVEGIVLDLRGNGGGFKQQCVEIASQFLPEGTVLFLEQDAKGDTEKIKAAKGGKALTLPLVVLIDRGSASSSEILAGALQDNHRAQLVGTQTFGTGTVLREYPLSDGSAVRLAIYRWFTPSGREIWHKGIQPDKGLEVQLPPEGTVTLPDPETPITEEEIRKAGDLPLLRGIEVLRARLANGERARNTER